MRRLLWYGNSSGSDRNPNSSDNPVCLSVQSYGTYCQHPQFTPATLQAQKELTNDGSVLSFDDGTPCGCDNSPVTMRVFDEW
jgi:hypothetical protein